MSPVLHAFFAQTAPDAAAPASPLANPIFMMVAIAAVFYFVMIRPQQKQAKQHQAFVTSLKKGDEVVTHSGIVGTVHAVEDRTVTLDVGAGTKLRIIKNQVAGQWKATEPAATEAKK
jgi:preprotein translocase subunit YajC